MATGICTSLRNVIDRVPMPSSSPSQLQSFAALVTFPTPQTMGFPFYVHRAHVQYGAPDDGE